MSGLPPWVTSSRDDLERESRARARSCLMGPRDVLCRVLGAYNLYAPAEDVSLAPHLALDGFWAAWETVVLGRLMRPGMACVDVGANCGYFSLVMAAGAGPAGRVLAVEPNPRYHPLLARTLAASGLARTAGVARVAAADAPGELTLSVPADHLGGASVALPVGGEAVRVPAVRLDTLLADWPRVDLVKIDAEGFEPQVWAGMRATLARCRPVVVLEFAPDRYADAAGFYAELCAAKGGVPRVIRHDAELTPSGPGECLAPGWEGMLVV